VTYLAPLQWKELWRATGGKLPSGARWWLRGATRGDVAAKRAFFIEGHGWFRGTATERGFEAELSAMVAEFAKKARGAREVAA
jgi:hypothetical protein